MQSQQTDLFTDHAMHPDRVTKYQRNSYTSKAAARDIESAAETLRGRLYRYLLTFPPGMGCTDEAMQIEFGMEGSTQRPRRVELVERGLVVDSGLMAKTKSGRAAVVWCAK